MDRLYPLLHIDAITYLPPEIIIEIFSYLDPQTLLRASTLSRAWRTQALDPRLWRRLFGAEGWSANVEAVKGFEDKHRFRPKGKGKARARSSEDITDAESQSPKRRIRERLLFGTREEDAVAPPFERSPEGPNIWAEQHGVIEVDEDENMEDILTVKAESSPSLVMEDIPVVASQSPSTSPSTPKIPAQGSLLIYTPGSTVPRLNWQYIYTQRRRLEENWIAGKYTNFQLPHPNHPYEAHQECVYTIQYTRKHLVSGSRDHTLRIWNLDTQRLMVPPLEGHDASVLCLQFDDRPSQDIVISGGSDCSVILWRFSTGKMIRKLKQAHAESVLNLRFDDRFLVTCSKDKTIKVWSRKAIVPTDHTYPHTGQSASARFPSYILNIDNLVENKNSIKPLEEYSLLMTLLGHTAAVNAIQILDNQIVSASGDRHVKVWDVKTGVCLKTIPGHQKGIACVQFDGRRIVSGSSDETVRIFDRSTAAEVACLRGHANLVRTVQARFGDIPGGAQDDEAEARDVDRKYYAAKLAGQLPTKEQPLTREERRARDAGGKDPKDVIALGAKLPPGGGGSRWARIVSGSYDETVIIWKRNPDGKWVPAHQLFQWQAVLNAGGQLRFLPAQPGRPGQPGVAPGQPQVGPQVNVHHHLAQNPQHVQAQVTATALVHQAQAQLAQAHASIGFAQHIVSQHQGTTVQTNISSSPSGAASQGSSAAATTGTVNGAPTSSAAPVPGQPQQLTNLQQIQLQAARAALHAHAHHHVHAQAQQAAQQQAQAQAQAQAQVPPMPQLPQGMQPSTQQVVPFVAHTLPHHSAQQASAAQTQHQGQHQGQQQQPNQNPAANTLPHHQHQHQQGGQQGALQLAPGTNSRVFKLQFDSRRIICCSQDPTIVGWDFANGDQEIVQASQFFGEDW